MADQELRFRRSRASPPPTGRGLAIALIVALALYAITRPLRAPDPAPGVLVEVRGDVPRPGTHLVEPPTIVEALQAAGGDASDASAGEIPPGHRVVVDGATVRIEPAGDPLLVGLPIELNGCTAEALGAVPGLSEGLAQAIVADRELRGPFFELQDVRRVQGIGGHTIDSLRAFVVVGEAPAVDLNHATAAQLETLPGVGPVTAARIVVERAQRGPFTKVDDLTRVDGVGPATISGLRDRVTVAGTP